MDVGLYNFLYDGKSTQKQLLLFVTRMRLVLVDSLVNLLDEMFEAGHFQYFTILGLCVGPYGYNKSCNIL